jgi:hypothetical protein
VLKPIAVLLAGILITSDLAPELGVRSRLRELAGKAAHDCGRAVKASENASKSTCAIDSYQHKVPFFVQYSVIGTDAHVEEGLAFDSQKKLFHVWTISESPLYGGKPSGKIEVHSCDANSLRKLDDGGLTCSFNPQ